MRENRSVIKSLNDAITGIIYVLRTQRNMRIHFTIAAAVLMIALLLGVSRWELALILLAISLVIVAELLNTAIESAIDVVTTTFDPLARLAKDVAAAAVLVASFNAILLGYLIFFHKVNPFSLEILETLRRSPIHLTTIGLLLVILVVISSKAWLGQKSFLRGGWPSGHSALAFSIAVGIAFLSKNSTVATLAILGAVITSHSRVEAGIHSFIEVLSGAFLGILTTVLIFQAFYLYG
jgi:diacylglycerol kinase (ATP)